MSRLSTSPKKAPRKKGQLSDAADASILRKFRKRPAMFTREFVAQVEETLSGDSDGARRRICMLVLSQPARRLLDDVAGDREYAVAVADVMNCIPGMKDRLRELCKFLETAEAWMSCALAHRDDMKDVIAEAEAEAKAA